MTDDKIIVLLLGALAIYLTYIFFFGKKETAIVSKGPVNINVSGGYSPSVIVIKNNAKTTLNFIRTDENSCLEEIIIPDFKIKKYLPLNEKVSVTLAPKVPGDYPFSCGMNMYFGKITVI